MTHSHEFDINDCGDESVKSFGIEVPEWIDQDIICSQVTGVNHGGCESGAYMPAVTYHKALETMNRYGNAVLDYLDDISPGFEIDIEGKSWGGIAVSILSSAVSFSCYVALFSLIARHAISVLIRHPSCSFLFI